VYVASKDILNHLFRRYSKLYSELNKSNSSKNSPPPQTVSMITQLGRLLCIGFFARVLALSLQVFLIPGLLPASVAVFVM